MNIVLKYFRLVMKNNLCRYGYHHYEDSLNGDNAHHVCVWCNHWIEFTEEEYKALGKTNE